MISVSLSSHVSIHRLVHGRTIAGLLKKREKQDKKTVGRKAYVPLTWTEVWGDESRRRNILRDAAEKSEVRELPCDVLIDCVIVHPSDMIATHDRMHCMPANRHSACVRHSKVSDELLSSLSDKQLDMMLLKDLMHQPRDCLSCV